MAGKVIDAIGPILSTTMNITNTHDDDSRGRNPQPAIHFVGHSLAGGVAAISACIMDGTTPGPPRGTHEQQDTTALSLYGSGRDRTSALCLGPPPCFSSNVHPAFVTCVMHGDDVVCRTTRATIDNLCDRTRQTIEGGLLGRSIGWMSQAVSGLRSNHGRRDIKLVVPGQVYLVRPRRMGGGSSSIHVVDGRGGTSLRAALLWQLNDILLSKSLWSHHQLEMYIRSLDRVRLKGFADDQSMQEDE